MLIKLTEVKHPEINNGQPGACYVDHSRVLVISAGSTQFVKTHSAEQHAAAMNDLHRTVNGVFEQLRDATPSMVADHEDGHKLLDIYMKAKNAADELSGAANLVNKYAGAPDYWPTINCTVVSLACGTGLEHGVMLSRVFVTETPEEVAEAIRKAWGDKWVCAA